MLHVCRRNVRNGLEQDETGRGGIPTPKHSGRLRGKGAILLEVSHRPARVRFPPPPTLTGGGWLLTGSGMKICAASAQYLASQGTLEEPWTAEQVRPCVLHSHQHRVVKSRIVCSWSGGGSGEEGSLAGLSSGGVWS